jgi:hypothetical protein
MADKRYNLLIATKDFQYLGINFQANDVIQYTLDALHIERVNGADKTCHIVNLSAFTSILKDEKYDSIRFIFENKKHLEFLRVKLN